ncbi:MAG: hypothetical protein O2793_13760 [Proteobacteria bacterium]|nr:hypothetical protein [Pseudomonadota bacterium]MDA1254941.1 hypothetical protein [Pseudomonadota bacterium]
MKIKLLHYLFLILAINFSTNLYAGTKVYGDGKTIEEAMENTKKNVEEAAKKAKRCVSQYPNIDNCSKLENGDYRCVGIRSNQKGSCK